MRIFFLIYGSFVITACNNNTKKEDNKGDSKKEDSVKVVYDDPTHLSTDTVFTAFGTEPFWAAYVISNNKIIFHPADGPDVEVPYVVARSGTASVQYSSSGNGNSIDMIIEKKDCSDGMSEETHAYSVTVSVNEKKYAGCGRKTK